MHNIQDVQGVNYAVLSKSWYAVLVMAGVERRACAWLNQRRLEPYWPRYEVDKRDFKTRRQILWRGVIPGYVFLPAPADCELVEDAPGVRRIMRKENGDLAEIPDTGKQGMEKIREIEASLNANPIAARDGIPFRVGQKVLVRSLELEGKITQLDGKRRIIVSVPMFGSRGVPVTVSVADIESV